MKLLGMIDKTKHQFVLDGKKYSFCIKCGWDKITIRNNKITPCIIFTKRESLIISNNQRHNFIYYNNGFCSCGYLYNYFKCLKCECVFSCCKACSVFDGCHISWTKGKTYKDEIPIIIKKHTDIEIPCRLSNDDMDVASIIL